VSSPPTPFAHVLAGLVVMTAVGCAPRPRMCTASSECATQSACVAGRCQPDRPNVKPAIDAARRLVVRPTDLAYLKRGDGPSGGALPPLFALGRDSAVLLMRFSVALPSTANVVEAYVVLRRSDAVDDDPAPISLHATRIVDAWEGRSISWALQPRVVEARTPATVVEPGGPALVRLDVRDLVRQWPKHDAKDQGIAVVAENETRTGTTFAFRSVASGATERGASTDLFSGSPTSPSSSPRQSFGPSSAPDVEPYLELYLR
jgi:hypothetical protein